MAGGSRQQPARRRPGRAKAGRGLASRGDAPRPAWRALPPGVALALVLVGVAWLHISALRLPFFADDYLFLDQVRGRSLWAALASPDPLRNFWRPVGRQLYFWLVALTGESPLAAHLLNLIIFAGIVAMLCTTRPTCRCAGPRVART